MAAVHIPSSVYGVYRVCVLSLVQIRVDAEEPVFCLVYAKRAHNKA